MYKNKGYKQKYFVIFVVQYISNNAFLFAYVSFVSVQTDCYVI